MDVVIRKRAEEWEKIAGVESQIMAWEKQTGKQLPEDYRAFMLKYNGGRIYPLIFKHNIPIELWDDGKGSFYLGTIFRWEYVEFLWGDPTQSYPRPENTLALGDDPGGIQVILSLQEKTYGQVFLSLFSEGPDDNQPILRTFHLANSFREFVFEKLYENKINEGYKYWYTPVDKSLIRKVEF